MRKAKASGKPDFRQSVTPISTVPQASPSEFLPVIAVNFIFFTVAIANIINLIPTQAVQVTKLQELEREVEFKQKTVDCLREQFSQSFNIGSAQVASLRKKGFISATQRPIKFTDDVTSNKVNRQSAQCS